MRKQSSSSNLKSTFEDKLFRTCLLVSVVSIAIATFAMFQAGISAYLTVFISLILFGWALFSAWQVKQSVTTQFQTLTNLIEAVSEGDYSLRGRQARGKGALSELTQQINILSDLLTKQRFEVKESQLLIDKIISHINVGIVSYDEEYKVSLVNPAAIALLTDVTDESIMSAADVIAKDVRTIVPKTILGAKNSVISLTLAGQTGRFDIHREQFIENNKNHHLLFITNVQAILREEERKAWQNLIRVISHEINNSLTPISSLSEMLLKQLPADTPTAKQGLEVIHERASGLRRFINTYKEVSAVPKPKHKQQSIVDFITNVTKLYPHQAFALTQDSDFILSFDPDLMQQVFINLIKNAIEANGDDTKPVDIHWSQERNNIVITLRDYGAGLANKENLFVPLYTTKPEGTGIGLLLSRQIVESHQGHLDVDNHSDGGCVVSIQLKL